MYRIFICFFLLFYSGNIFSQGQKIKELEQKINAAKNIEEKYSYATELILEWIKTDVEKGKALAIEYLKSATKENNKKYIARFTNSLANAHLFLGEYEEAKTNYIKAYRVAKKNNDHDLSGRVCANLGMYFEFNGQYDSSLYYYYISVQQFSITQDTTNIADTYNGMATTFYRQFQYDSSNFYLYKALDLHKKMNNREGIADITFNLGNNFSSSGENSKALENYTIADRIYDSLQLNNKLAETKANIGSVFFDQENYLRALDLYRLALKLNTKLKNLNNISGNQFAIANCFSEIKEFDSAKIYYDYALESYFQLSNKKGLASTKASLGILEFNKKNYQGAIQLYNEALKLHIEIENESGIAHQYLNLGKVYLTIGKYAAAYDNAKKAYAIFKKLEYIQLYPSSLILLSETAEKNMDYKNGFYYLKELISLNDSLNTIENQKLLVEMETQYNTREKDARNKILEQENELKNVALKAAEEEEARINTLLYFSIGIIAIILIFLFYVYRVNIARKKTNELLAQRNEFIIKQNESIREQKEIIEEKQKEITDSINYAVRIQRSLLASDELLKEELKDHFVYFQPKDIVSGDFYWAVKQNNKFHIVCADCTGHGVPGAFMSLLGVSFLNEITKEKNITDPDLVLNNLREKIINVLNQGQQDQNAKDGMDGVFCSIDYQNKTIEIAAANNPIWIIRKTNEEISVIEIKPDKMPIGLYNDMRPFSKHQINLQQGDQVYCFTDGFPDQFGGDKGKKLKYTPFKQFFIDNYALNMTEKKEKLSILFNEWKGEIEQTDDVCVIGILI